MVRAADGSHATLDDRDDLASFTPDLPGVWRLRDCDGRTLDLIAGRYEDVPLDCSRARCHAEMLASSLVNPMTTVMARLLDGFPKQAPNAEHWAEYPGCALSCHATGEPGISDGGFHDLALSMNLMPRLADRDLQLLSVDRNVADPLRIAARKRLVGGGR